VLDPVRRLASLEPRLVGALTLRLAALLVFSTALMMFIDVPLQGEAAPFGIVSFELAATPRRALAILVEWRTRAVLGYAKLSLGVDFLYLLVYGGFFATLATWVGQRLVEPAWSRRAASAALVAAGFDVLENLVLWIEVARVSSPAPYPQLALAFAVAKFTLIGAAGLYGIVGAVRVFLRR